MARPVTTLVIFFLALNLFAGMLMGTGTAAMLGLDANVGEEASVDETVENADEIDSGSPTGDNLFGMYNVLANQVRGLTSTLFPGLVMLERAGVPTFITREFAVPIFTVMISIMVMSFLRGWDL